MYLSHISTLEEAAAYLSGKTGESWTPKSVLDFALTKSKQSSRKPAPIAFAAMPIGTTFGRYEFTSPGGMVRKGSARWQLVPLYPIHAAQLVAAGNTFAGLVESPDDDHADGEHYAFIEPLESEHEITLDMVRLKRAAIESIAKQCPAASSGAPESAEPPAESGVRKEGIAETPSRTTEKYKASWPTCTKHELIDCFLLTGKNWEDTLSRPSKYDSAKSQPGRKGKGGDALWFPITFAGLLVQHEEFTQSQVKTRFLKIAEWKKWESELLAEIGMI